MIGRKRSVIRLLVPTEIVRKVYLDKMKNLMCLILLLAFPFGIAVGQSEYFVETKEVHLRYLVYGEGDPVLIINGGPGFNCEGFQPLAKHITSMGFQAILFDQRGTGESRFKQEENFSMRKMSEDIDAIRKDLGVDEWVVLGHSFGGMLGAFYASHFSNEVKALIFSSSGGIDLSLLENYSLLENLTEAQQDSLSYWTGRLREGDTSRMVRMRRAEILAHAYVYDKSHVGVVAKRLQEVDMRINRLVWENMREIEFDCKPSLANFNKPALILQGAQDVLPLRIAKIADETMPHSKMVIMEKCGHYGWLDAPDQYLGSIQTFLKELSDG